MSRRSVILLLATLHLVATVALTLATINLRMDRFDTGAPPMRTERTIEACGQVLRFPIVMAAFASKLRFPGLTGYLPFILNSLLWGVAASGLFLGLRRLGRHLVARSTSPAGDI